jgi:glyceraldehyde-3-phosphate dehydrogenase (NADP+)
MRAWHDESMAALFPAPVEIPAHVRIATRDGGGFATTLLGHEAQLGADDAVAAVDAAAAAWCDGEGVWPSAPVEIRIAAVLGFAAAVEAKTDEIATMLMWEIGKPWPAARDEVTRSVEYMPA